MIIGSHVNFGSEQLLGSAKQAVSFGANTFMFYTGAPQNTIRKEIDLDLTKEDAKKLENMSYNDLFVFYSTAVNSFTGMVAPSVRQMRENQEKALQALDNTDPKQNSEN